MSQDNYVVESWVSKTSMFAISTFGDHPFNPLKPNDPYICRTAPLTSRRCILYIYSTNIRNEYFKHAANSPFFPLQNAVYFIILHCLVPVLFAFYVQSVLKFKCKIQAPKELFKNFITVPEESGWDNMAGASATFTPLLLHRLTSA